MNRDEMIDNLKNNSEIWDFIIIGGGATGVGTAIEAASRGYKTLLVEQGDFGQGTSSRSTKLVHGGVRYLKQGNISLVLEALKERSLMLKNAPHVVHNLPFIVPNYDWWECPFYGVGLKLYDMLAGKHGFGDSKILSKEDMLKRIPTIEPEGLRHGVIYYDGQFDDARLLINLVRTAYEQGAVLINYMKATSLIKSGNFVKGIVGKDVENDVEYELQAKVVINATGVFADSVRRMDDAECLEMIKPSQGVHIVLDKSFMPGDSAIMVPHTDDGRVLFAIPWQNRVLVGTTDTFVPEILIEPRPLSEEIEFLLTHAARYLTKDPTPSDVLSTFAGLRPLVNAGSEDNTSEISRDHTLHISGSGLVTIIGGKWTTYRKMGQDTIDQALELANLDEKPSVTKNLQIHGYHSNASVFGDLHIYGSDAPEMQTLFKQNKKYKDKIHPNLEARIGEIVWSVNNEMARTVEDFLSRRTRSLLLDAKASIEAASKVADIMAKELHKSKTWKRNQILHYTKLAKGYLLA